MCKWDTVRVCSRLAAAVKGLPLPQSLPPMPFCIAFCRHLHQEQLQMQVGSRHPPFICSSLETEVWLSIPAAASDHCEFPVTVVILAAWVALADCYKMKANCSSLPAEGLVSSTECTGCSSLLAHNRGLWVQVSASSQGLTVPGDQCYTPSRHLLFDRSEVFQTFRLCEDRNPNACKRNNKSIICTKILIAQHLQQSSGRTKTQENWITLFL